jgi:hypothetical protein
MAWPGRAIKPVGFAAGPGGAGHGPDLPPGTVGRPSFMTADGSVEVFRDRSIRDLRVEPDAKTGEMRPVTKGGRTVSVWLCREDRESR